MHKIAIYDMDKTITRRATYSAFLMWTAWRRTPWRLILAPVSAVFGLAYMLGILDRRALKQHNQRLFLGGNPHGSELKPYIGKFADRTVRRNLHPGARAQIRRDHDEGYRLVLATASYRLYAHAIADRLGFDDIIATNLEKVATGHIIPLIDGDNCYGPAKLAMIQAWMEQHGLERADCHIRAYSDHVSDVPLLEFADEPVAAHPDRNLLAVATERGWPVRKWHAPEII